MSEGAGFQASDDLRQHGGSKENPAALDPASAQPGRQESIPGEESGGCGWAEQLGETMANAFLNLFCFGGATSSLFTYLPGATTEPEGQPKRSTVAHYGKWDSATKRIVLIGDSSLDNILWIGEGQSISRQLLRDPEEVAVCNLAADGFTTADVLHGSSRVISARARADRERIWWTGDSFEPLQQLKDLQPAPTHIVLSVGGNDVRHILGNLSQLPRVLKSLTENYVEIAHQIKEIAPDSCLILMLQYRPCCDPEEDRFYRVYAAMDTLPASAFPQLPPKATSLEKLNCLMETIYGGLLPQLVHLHPKIIDMPNSFEVRSKVHYSHQIEPSEEGGKVIAELIHAAANSSSGEMRWVKHDTSSEVKLFHYDRDRCVKERQLEFPWRVWVDDATPTVSR